MNPNHAPVATELPAAVAAACRRSEAAGFGYSSEPLTGQLLATLSAAIRPGGRILELGTGAGVGLAWIGRGLGARRDVRVISVEHDESLAAAVRQAGLPMDSRCRSTYHERTKSGRVNDAILVGFSIGHALRIGNELANLIGTDHPVPMT